MASRVTAPVRSFYDAGLYREVARDWKGTGLAYLFLLLLVLGLAVGLRVGFSVAHLGGDPTFLEFVEQIPPIAIRDGVVTADVEQPYRLVDADDPDSIIVVDTTGEVTEIDPAYEKGMLLTRNKLIYRKSRMETREFDLSQIESFEIDAGKVIGWLGPLGWILGIGTAVLLPLVAFPYRAFVALVLAGIGSGLSRPLGASLAWTATYRLACVAMTPSIVVGTAVLLFAPGEYRGCSWWPLWGVVNLVYLLVALRANRAPEPAPQI